MTSGLQISAREEPSSTVAPASSGAALALVVAATRMANTARTGDATVHRNRSCRGTGKRMSSAWRLYRRYIGISIRSQLQYPASFVMASVGILLVTGIEFLGVWALFDRFGTIRGWSLPEVALFYGIISI